MKTIPKHVARLLSLITHDTKRIAKESIRPVHKKPEFWLTLILGIITLIQALYTSKQAQTIDGFDTLLKKVDTQTHNISAQLEISRKSQEHSNEIYELQRKVEANKLLAGISSIEVLISDINLIYKEESGLKVKDYLPSIKEIMKAQLDNSFLMENSVIANDWVENEIFLEKSITYINQQYHVGNSLNNQQIYNRCIPVLMKCINITKAYCNEFLNNKNHAR